MQGLRYIEGVTTLSLNADLCIGCGMCVSVCPHQVFSLQDKRATVLDKDACMECGACARNCPAGALSVKQGVGCAAAIIIGYIRGTEPTCDCSGDGASCC